MEWMENKLVSFSSLLKLALECLIAYSEYQTEQQQWPERGFFLEYCISMVNENWNKFIKKKVLLMMGAWVTPVILATQEAEIRRIAVWSQSGQTVHETLSQKYPAQKGLMEWHKV
jgi:hypothetical protein